MHLYFYPRSPCGERPKSSGSTCFRIEISIHALLAESDLYCLFFPCIRLDISIHALLAESDSSRLRIKSRLAYISIHAFLAESDGCVERSCKGITIFLSTLSLRRATVSKLAYYSPSPFLSTLSLRRATIPSNGTLRRTHISIHALLAESDFIRNRLDCAKLAFLSTLSLRRATVPTEVCLRASSIFLSTLSLRRATLKLCFYPNPSCHFYPRSPCGERQVKHEMLRREFIISIHALLAESDV